MQDEILRSKRKFYYDWLAKNSDWFVNELWKIMNVLRNEQELLGKNEIKIPINRLKEKNINLEDAKKIFINLENQKIISSYCEVNRTPDDPFKPSVSVGVNLSEEEGVFYDLKTRLTLSHEFKYLYQVLEEIKDKEKKEEVSPLTKKAQELMDTFSQNNLPFVIRILGGIKRSSEFASTLSRVSYELQSGSMTDELIWERNLLRKLESFGLFRHAGEDGIYGITTLLNLDSALLNECIGYGRSKIVNERVLEATIPVISSPVSEVVEKLVNPKEYIKNVVEEKNFPKKQKKLLKALSKMIPLDTDRLKFKTDTTNLPSLLFKLRGNLKNNGLHKIITIKHFKKDQKDFYQLQLNPQ